MTDYVTRDDTNLGVGRILTSPTMYALYDNPTAIAEGAAGAPRIEDAALDTTVTTAGTDWVLARNAGAATGAVGTYAWLGSSTANSAITAGSTYAGSGLRYTGLQYQSGDSGVRWDTVFGGTPSGTWRAVGTMSGSVGYLSVTMFLRIS